MEAFCNALDNPGRRWRRAISGQANEVPALNTFLIWVHYKKKTTMNARTKINYLISRIIYFLLLKNNSDEQPTTTVF